MSQITDVQKNTWRLNEPPLLQHRMAKQSHQGNARAAHWAASSYTWKLHLFSNLVFLKLIHFIYIAALDFGFSITVIPFHVQEMERLPCLDGLSLWQLVQILIAVARAIGRKVGNDGAPPGLDADVEEQCGPPQPAQGHQAPYHVQNCHGACIICGRQCVRLERGHKHCKCRPHMHTR